MISGFENVGFKSTKLSKHPTVVSNTLHIHTHVCVSDEDPAGELQFVSLVG